MPRIPHFTFILPTACVLACLPVKGNLGEYTTTDQITGTTEPDDTTLNPKVPEPDHPEAPDETSTTSTTDTTATASTTDDPTDAPSEVQHPACALPFPATAPPLPPINWDADDRPRFDEWRDLGCEGLDAGTCEAPDNAFCGKCLKGVEDGTGVCVLGDSDIWCDGGSAEGEALGFGGGDCWQCAPLSAHAFACCNFPEGYDCRAWPYPSDGPPNSICARHEDCEPGLVCGPHRGSGYGICQCPGSDSDEIAPPKSCFN